MKDSERVVLLVNEALAEVSASERISGEKPERIRSGVGSWSVITRIPGSRWMAIRLIAFAPMRECVRRGVKLVYYRSSGTWHIEPKT
jgi:hypothetical protein